MQPFLRRIAAIALSVILLCTCAFADGEGQATLDQATKKKLRARSADDLREVAELCESAIEKGLSDDAEKYARSLWSSCLYERAFAISRPVLSRPPHEQWRTLRQIALEELDKALEVDENIGDVHLLIAQLEGLQGGDSGIAFDSAERAIQLFPENGQKRSEAFVLRGRFQKDIKDSADDFDKAVEIDPRNQDAWRAKGLTHLQRDETEKAIDAFQQLLELDPADPLGNQSLAELFSRQNQNDKALEQLKKAIDAGATTPGMYVLQADLLAKSGKMADAIGALTSAVKVDSSNMALRLILAQTLLQNGDIDLAQEQLEVVLKKANQADLRDDARVLRSIVYSVKSQFSDAIRDIRSVLTRVGPDNARRPDLLLYLTRYYTSDQRPTKAIETASEILTLNENAWEAYRWRGDAFLSLGQHKKAIDDYEAAWKLNENDSGILNNFAWVLATSPDDQVRDGERAVKIATKACEVTEFKQAHILSTLAAAYAETGDFDTAVKWSAKAVELDSDEEQLENELESYKNKKPWRELQQVEEKKDDVEASEDDLQLDDE
ncbi:MAG: tetratricopeptide repeat protein [Planctomycetales bacterium]|nr:tetratricopeptide repeat protein [Planctomycetales bacterium]